MSLQETRKPLSTQQPTVSPLTCRTRPESSVNIPSLWSTGPRMMVKALSLSLPVSEFAKPDLNPDPKSIFISLLTCLFISFF